MHLCRESIENSVSRNLYGENIENSVSQNVIKTNGCNLQYMNKVANLSVTI